MEDQNPKKRKRGRPKGSKNKKKPDISNNNKKSESFPEEEYEIYIDSEDIDGVDEEVFQEMLVEALRNVSKEKKYTRNCKIALSSTVEEFISSFILIGFDFNGDPVEIIKAKSAMETDALGMSLQKLVTKYFSRQLPPEL